MEWITKIILISAFTGILAGPMVDSPAENETCTTENSGSNSTSLSTNFTDTLHTLNQSTDSTNATADNSTVETQMLESKDSGKIDLSSEPDTTVITTSFDSSTTAKEIADDNASRDASTEISTLKSSETRPQKDYVESASYSGLPVSKSADATTGSTPAYISEDSSPSEHAMLQDSSSSPEINSVPQVSSLSDSSTELDQGSSSENSKEYSSSQFTTAKPSKDTSSVESVSEKPNDEKSYSTHSAVKRSLGTKSETKTLAATEKEDLTDARTTLPADENKDVADVTTENSAEVQSETVRLQSEITVSPTLPTSDSTFLYSTADVSGKNQFSENSAFSTAAKFGEESTTIILEKTTPVSESKTEIASVNISESSERAHTEEPKDQSEGSNQAPETSNSTTTSEDSNTETDAESNEKSSANARTDAGEETNGSNHNIQYPEENPKVSTKEFSTVSETHSTSEAVKEKAQVTTEVNKAEDKTEVTEKHDTKPGTKPEVRSRGERSSESKISEIRILPSEASTLLGDSIIKEKSSSATPVSENRDSGFTNEETSLLYNNTLADGSDPEEKFSTDTVPFDKTEFHTTVSTKSVNSSTSVNVNQVNKTLSGSAQLSDASSSKTGTSHLSEVHTSDLWKNHNVSTISSHGSLLPVKEDTSLEITTSPSQDKIVNIPLSTSGMPETKVINHPEILRDVMVSDSEFSNSNILPTVENSASLIGTSKEESSSNVNSIITESPSSKFQTVDTLTNEHNSNSVIQARIENGLALENISVEETSETSVSGTQKGESVYVASPTRRKDDGLLNDSPSGSEERTIVENKDDPEKETLTVSQRTEDKVSNSGSQVPSNFSPVAPTVVQPTHVSWDNSSIVSTITEERVQLMPSDPETSDVVESEELPVALLIPVNVHSTPESIKSTVTFFPVNETAAIPLSNSSPSDKFSTISTKVSDAESLLKQKSEDVNPTSPTGSQSTNNSTIVRVEVKSSVSEASPVHKMENSSKLDSSVLHASETPKTEQQTSETPSPSAEEPPVASSNSSGITPTQSTTETTTKRFAIRKPKIRLNGDSDTVITSSYSRRISTSTRKPTTAQSGPPVSIFRRNRTRIGHITSSTTARPTAAYSVRRASFRPVHIVGTETFSFSLPPTTTVPTPTTTEEEEEEEEEDIVELEEDHSADEGQPAPTVSEEDDVTVIKYSASMVVNKGIRWKKQLNSRPSPEYKREEKRMRQTLERIFRGSSVGPYLWKVEIDGFSEKFPKSRLITVDYFVYVLKTENPPDSAELIQAFNERLVNDSFSRYTFSPENTFIEYFSEERLNKPTESPEMEPPIPQWAIAVIVIGAASFIFIVLFAAVTVYGRHHMRRRYASKLDDELERSVDSRDWEKKLGTAAAYENLAADVVYDVDDCGTGVDNVKRSYFLD